MIRCDKILLLIVNQLVVNVVHVRIHLGMLLGLVEFKRFDIRRCKVEVTHGFFDKSVLFFGDCHFLMWNLSHRIRHPMSLDESVLLFGDCHFPKWNLSQGI